jgi:uncharacterized protein (DUF58 family)
MLTPRAWWLLVFVLAMLAVGLLGQQPVLGLVGLALLIWMIWEGLLFNFRARWLAGNLSLTREVRDDRGPVSSLWAGRSFEVRLVLNLEANSSLPHVAFDEPLPFGVELTGGEGKGDGTLIPGRPLGVAYRVRPLHPGLVRFEGVRVQLADLHGLFYQVSFVRVAQTFRVLPALVDAEGKTATSKRHNLLPPPGINRLPRPGTGSELLDLRDYLPGDPPKTIAWKVSARRDRLITKEYESEVPLRCTLFVDTSNSVRLGPPGEKALTRLVEIASGVTQANLAVRDLTGLCLFDEERVSVTRPARNRRHLIQVFNQLADAAGLAPARGRQTPIGGTDHVDALLPLAYSFALEVYPERMTQRVNRVPWWLPFFVRIPGLWAQRPTWASRLYRWPALTVATVLYLLVSFLILAGLITIYSEPIPEELFALTREIAETSGAHLDLEEFRNQILPPDLLSFIAWLVATGVILPLWLRLVRDAVPLLFQTKRRRLTRYRKKLAALFSQEYGLGPGGLELLLEDDDLMNRYLERFLSDHHVPHTPVLHDRQGRFLFASPGKVEVLAGALMRAVGKGHDNELFVLMVDLVELEDQVEPLLRAVKVALARHHQVMVVCPWPPGLAPPRDAAASETEVDPLAPPHQSPLTPAPRSPLPKTSGACSSRGSLRGDRPGRSARRPRVPRGPHAGMPESELKDFLKELMARHYQRSFHRLRRTFARLQVPMVCAAAGDPVHLILERLDRLRGVHRRRG